MKSMKIFLVAVILLCAALSASAEGLLDNPDYQAALQLQKSADEAYASGDYVSADNYSAQAEALLNKLLAASGKDALKDQADSLIKAVDARLAKLDVKRANKDFPDQLKTARSDQQGAKDAFTAADYQTSIDKARAALAALDQLDTLLAQGTTPTPEGEIVLPRYYVVRLIPANRD
jgi:hypothetical protein